MILQRGLEQRGFFAWKSPRCSKTRCTRLILRNGVQNWQEIRCVGGQYYVLSVPHCTSNIFTLWDDHVALDVTLDDK